MHLEEGGIVLEDNFKNCKSIYLVRRDGSKKESLEKVVFTLSSRNHVQTSSIESNMDL